ncbi:hypothetical protein ES703_124566 [subsurface metagenome]
MKEYLHNGKDRGLGEAKEKQVDDEFLRKIGLQGEENALYYLKKIKKDEYKIDSTPSRSITNKEGGFIFTEDGKNIFEANWENVHKEQYKGYDISYIDENEIKHYIEVKSTVSSSKDWFYITENEWKYFLKKGKRYFIYRVHNVEIGKKYNDDVYIIENPCKEWREGKIIAYPYKIEI